MDELDSEGFAPDGSVSHVEDVFMKNVLKRSRVAWLLVDKFKEQGRAPPAGLLFLAAKTKLSKRRWETLMWRYRRQLTTWSNEPATSEKPTSSNEPISTLTEEQASTSSDEPSSTLSDEPALRLSDEPSPSWTFVKTSAPEHFLRCVQQCAFEFAFELVTETIGITKSSVPWHVSVFLQVHLQNEYSPSSLKFKTSHQRNFLDASDKLTSLLSAAKPLQIAN